LSDLLQVINSKFDKDFSETTLRRRVKILEMEPEVYTVSASLHNLNGCSSSVANTDATLVFNSKEN
jgi:hypothetical protein